MAHIFYNNHQPKTKTFERESTKMRENKFEGKQFSGKIHNKGHESAMLARKKMREGKFHKTHWDDFFLDKFNQFGFDSDWFKNDLRNVLVQKILSLQISIKIVWTKSIKLWW